MRIILLLFFISYLSFSQKSKDCTVLLKTEAVSGESPSITVSWEPVEFAYEYEVLRRQLGVGNFIQLASGLGEDILSYIDENVEQDITYEYQVRTKSRNGEFRWRGFGYISSSINKEPLLSPGKVLILVDSTVAEPLSEEITRLEMDLAAENWGVVVRLTPREEVFDKEKVQAVKNIILEERLRDLRLNTVMIIGRVPVPYAGGFTNSMGGPPDGHGEGAGNHTGAWPADLYYGDIDGFWTDNSTKVTTGNREINHNIPGDGKFDQTNLPSNIDLAVGRIDFYDMPAFEESEIELLRKYLDKNHGYRTGEMIVETKALIDESAGGAFQFGNNRTEAFSANGWRNLAPLVGAENVESDEWIDKIYNNNYLWAYGTGAGSFSSAGGVINTGNISENNINAVFTMLFGSYFGNWDSRNNLMRAAIAADGNSLTCAWAARPSWFFHRMGAGNTVGEAAIISQNNNDRQSEVNSNAYYNLAFIEANFLQSNGQKVIVENGYSIGFGTRQIHPALMGDPTLVQDSYLRLPGASSLTAVKNEDGSISLEWDGGPTDDIKDWDIFRSRSFQGPYEKINEDIVQTETFTDEMPYEGYTNIYVVRRRNFVGGINGTRLAYSRGAVVAINRDGVLSIDISENDLRIGPNPAKDFINIEFDLHYPSPVEVQIFDQNGTQIKSYSYDMLNGTGNLINWDFGNSISNGVYFVNIKTNNSSITKKILVVK